MTVKELKNFLKDLPDETEVEVAREDKAEVAVCKYEMLFSAGKYNHILLIM